jgi:hypothetical protein
VPSPHPDPLWRLATAQWAEITANSPDLAPAVALQQQLLRLQIDASRALEETGDIGSSALPAASSFDKWQRGLPALYNHVVAIPPALKDVLPPLCTALAEGGAGESALHIRDAITSNGIDADSLLRVSLARNQKAIRTSALHMGLSPDLLWLIGELGSAPLAHRLAAGLKASTTTDAAGIRGADLPDPDPRSADPRGADPHRTDPHRTDPHRADPRSADPRSADLQVGLHWNRGYCPCCGSWPVFIEAGDAHTLRCSYCAFDWSLAPHGCVYCGNVGADFVAAALDVGAPQQRVELCGACGGYTKVIDVQEPTPFPLLAIGDLATMHLDHGAMARGYRRPVLFDLDAIEPRVSC